MNAVFASIGRMVGRSIPSSRIRGWILRQYYPFVRGKQILKQSGGINYSLDLDEYIDVSVSLGIFEVPVQKALAAYCKPGMVVIDIGANIGAHALPMSQMVLPGGRVYGFEPTKYAYDKLTKNVSLNPQLPIQVFRVALSDHEAESQEIHFRSSWCTNGNRKDTPCTVDFIRLDDWADFHKVDARIAVIKMDVDGNEFPIIAGGEKVILRDRPIFVMEAVGPHFTREDQNPIGWLWKHGWSFFTLDRRHRFSSVEEIGSALPDNDPLMTKSINILAIHEKESA